MRFRPVTTTGAAGPTPDSDRKAVRLHSRSAIGLLLAAGAALLATFELAPRVLLRPPFGAYSDAKLHDDIGRALVEYWRSGTRALPAHLTSLVDYWFQWHAIKVVNSRCWPLSWPCSAPRCGRNICVAGAGTRRLPSPQRCRRFSSYGCSR